MLRLIESNPRPIPDYERKYFDAYKRKTDEIYVNPDSISVMKQAVFYGVKWVNSNPGDLTAEDLFVMYAGIMDLIGSLTPAELITIFPIEKRYDGDRWGVKDYFYTMAELNKIGMGEKIGADRALDLLWDYENPDLRVFTVRCMSTLGALRQVEGEASILEDWADKNGVDVYRQYAYAATGKRFMLNCRTGKTTKTKRVLPRYLKIVK